MKHFVVYNLATGSVLRAGTCLDQDFDGQAQAGEGVIEASASAIIVAEVNLQPVKDSAAAAVDLQAEEVRSRFLAIGSGQAMTYLAKQAEAVAVLANPSVPTPFLTAEADATGVTVAALAAVVQANAVAWQTIGAAIEAARRKARVEIEAATNVAEIHTAATINWQAVLS